MTFSCEKLVAIFFSNQNKWTECPLHHAFNFVALVVQLRFKSNKNPNHNLTQTFVALCEDVHVNTLTKFFGSGTKFEIQDSIRFQILS